MNVVAPCAGEVQCAMTTQSQAAAAGEQHVVGLSPTSLAAVREAQTPPRVIAEPWRQLNGVTTTL